MKRSFLNLFMWTNSSPSFCLFVLRTITRCLGFQLIHLELQVHIEICIHWKTEISNYIMLRHPTGWNVVFHTSDSGSVIVIPSEKRWKISNGEKKNVKAWNTISGNLIHNGPYFSVQCKSSAHLRMIPLYFINDVLQVSDNEFSQNYQVVQTQMHCL